MNSNEAIKDVEIMPFAAGAHSKGPNEIRGTSGEVIKVSPLLLYIFMFGKYSLLIANSYCVYIHLKETPKVVKYSTDLP